MKRLQRMVAELELIVVFVLTQVLYRPHKGSRRP
jgi:hypothetical protein